MIDILSDIGGLNGLFATFFALILSVLNHNHFDSTLASQLYTFSDRKKKEQRDDSVTGFTPIKTHNVKEYFLDSLPSYLHCCKRSKKQLLIEKARDCLSDEIDIVEIVRLNRFMKAAIA